MEEKKWTEQDEREFQEYLREKEEEHSRKMELLTALEKEVSAEAKFLEECSRRVAAIYSQASNDREAKAMANLAQRILISAVNNLRTVRVRPFMTQSPDERELRREFQRTYRRR